MTQIHPWALHAAVDANCLASQLNNSYWNYVDYVHLHNEGLSHYDNVQRSDKSLDGIAYRVGKRDGLNMPKLKNCIETQDDRAIRASMSEATSLQIDGTPALFVQGEPLSGAQSKNLLWAAIDRALKAEGVMPPANPKINGQ